MVAEVAVEGTKYSFDRIFYYKIPDDLVGKVKLGQCVFVPFGVHNTQRKGYVFNVIKDFHPAGNENLKDFVGGCEKSASDNGNSVLVEKLKNINDIVDECQFLGPELLRLVFWFSHNAFCTFAEAIGVILPPGLEKKKTKHLTVALCADFLAGTTNITAKQQAVVNLLAAGEHLVKDLLKTCKVSRQVLDALVKKNAIRYTWKETKSDRVCSTSQVAKIPTSQLSEEEQELTLQLSCAQKKQQAVVVLVVGGRLEDSMFLLSLACSTLSCGRSILILVPEIEGTSQLKKLFCAYFENIVVLHSGLSDAKRVDIWHMVNGGRKMIVVGTRSAVFAPISDLGAIVVINEHDSSFLSEHKPLYSAIEVAKFRAKFNCCPLILVSATPAIVNFYKAKNGIYKSVLLSCKPNNNIEILVSNMRQAAGACIFGSELLKAISLNLEQGKQSVVILDRKGYSTVIKCPNCRGVLKCPNCSVNLTYHSDGLLYCHKCKQTRPDIAACEVCGSGFVEYSGFGLEKVEAQLLKRFDAKVKRLDATMGVRDFESACEGFAQHKFDILIGTQIVTRVPSFFDVNLVGVLGCDQYLSSSDYRGTEQAFAFLTKVANRMKSGRIILQTQQPNNDFFDFFKMQDYFGFFENEIELRKVLNLPPFCDITTIVFSGKSPNLVYTAAVVFMDMLQGRMAVEASKPTPANIFKLNANYRYKIVIKQRNNVTFRSTLRTLLLEFLNNHQQRAVKVVVDACSSAC